MHNAGRLLKIAFSDAGDAPVQYRSWSAQSCCLKSVVDVQSRQAQAFITPFQKRPSLHVPDADGAAIVGCEGQARLYRVSLQNCDDALVASQGVFSIARVGIPHEDRVACGCNNLQPGVVAFKMLVHRHAVPSGRRDRCWALRGVDTASHMDCHDGRCKAHASAMLSPHPGGDHLQCEGPTDQSVGRPYLLARPGQAGPSNSGLQHHAGWVCTAPCSAALGCCNLHPYTCQEQCRREPCNVACGGLQPQACDPWAADAEA